MMQYFVKNNPQQWIVAVDVIDELLIGDTVININPRTPNTTAWKVDWPTVTGVVGKHMAVIWIVFLPTVKYRVSSVSHGLGDFKNELSITLDELDNQEEE